MKKAKTKLTISILCTLIFLGFPGKYVFANFYNLYDFDYSTGSEPFGSLKHIGNTLYGTTTTGGSSWKGTIFKINTDGSDFERLHNFQGGTNDGAYPYDDVLILDTKLYGLTNMGGDSDMGTIYKMNTDGTNFELIHDFLGGVNDGKYPGGNFVLYDGALYGTTINGGTSNKGVVFKINTDGSGFTLLHQFVGGVNDGSNPYDTPVVYEGKLYGTTRNGGDGGDNKGTLFRMNLDGTGFQLIHEFLGGVNDGAKPFGSLTEIGGAFYGTTILGGDHNLGTIFKINPDGTGFSLLYEFELGGLDGTYPESDVTYFNGAVYGMASEGGTGGNGVIFRMNLDGTGYSVLHDFDNDTGYGWPYGKLIFVSGRFYGLTGYGGSDGAGSIFSFSDDDTPPSDEEGNATGNEDASDSTQYTSDREVTLTLSATEAEFMMISEDPDFTGAEWETYAPTTQFTLSEDDGQKTIYIKYRDAAGNETSVVTETITLDSSSPMIPMVGLREDKLYKVGERDFEVNERRFKLYFDTSDKTTSVYQIKLSRKESFKGATWKEYDGDINMTLPDEPGEHHIYIKLKDHAGNISDVFTQLINYDPKEGSSQQNMTLEKIGTVEYNSAYRDYFYTEGKITLSGNGRGVLKIDDTSCILNYASEKWTCSTDLTEGKHTIGFGGAQINLTIDSTGLSFPGTLKTTLGF